jgi:integrase
MATIEKRINNDKSVSYRVKVRLKGYPVQSATFDRITDAKKWASDTEADLRAGRYFKTAAAKKHTLGDLIDRYIKNELVKKPKAIAAQKPQLLWWKNELGSYLLADITPVLIVECRDKLSATNTKRNKPTSNATVNRYIAALSTAFTIAIKEWGWLDDNPIRKVNKLKEPDGRSECLSDENRRKLLTACKESTNEFLHLIVMLALSTGARKMEVGSLKWSDVSFKRNIITLNRTKNGDRRVLPLAGHALTLMRAHAETNKKDDDSYVFPSKNGKKPIDIRTPWETALKKADIKNFRFHDLRHTAASYLAMNGASTAELAAVLGHRTLSMVKRYSHLSDSHTVGVVTRMNNKIFGETE